MRLFVRIVSQLFLEVSSGESEGGVDHECILRNDMKQIQKSMRYEYSTSSFAQDVAEHPRKNGLRLFNECEWAD